MESNDASLRVIAHIIRIGSVCANSMSSILHTTPLLRITQSIRHLAGLVVNRMTWGGGFLNNSIDSSSVADHVWLHSFNQSISPAAFFWNWIFNMNSAILFEVNVMNSLPKLSVKALITMNANKMNFIFTFVFDFRKYRTWFMTDFIANAKLAFICFENQEKNVTKFYRIHKSSISLPYSKLYFLCMQ